MSTRTAPRKTADDQPFDFNLDAVEAEVELRPFRFHWKRRRWEMEHLQGLDVWGLMEAAEQGETGAMLGVFQAALGDDFAEFHKIPLPQYKLKPLFDAYRHHCGLAEGESPASES
ncbi:hypothetical protein [Streptomyces rimosus]|uniref:hypothetical protein n=1 Tax=Streptomyces rimosus TaxID=1927 RepID=UPI0004C952C6|nr:hypothetical protein [Streptomyces rimosus]